MMVLQVFLLKASYLALHGLLPICGLAAAMTGRNAHLRDGKVQSNAFASRLY